MLGYLLQQHGIYQQNYNFNFTNAPAVASVTITNQTTAEITLYRLRSDGQGTLVGIVPCGFTVSMKPFVLNTKLRAMNVSGESWEFVVDQNTETWTLTPSGWTGSVGLPHSIVGKWIGYYPDCGEEVIEVVEQGNQFIATKVTGDDYVPAGQITWRATSCSDIHNLQCEIQVASAGFTNPSFTAGTLSIVSEVQIVLHWGNDGTSSITYRRWNNNVETCHPSIVTCHPVAPVVPVQQVLGSNLIGQWIGYYSGCGEEIIQLHFQGDQLVATKVTGDKYVPAGQITWRVRMTSATAGTGQGQVAYPGFRSPYWKNGDLKVLDENRISFGSSQWPTITYRRKVC